MLENIIYYINMYLKYAIIIHYDKYVVKLCADCADVTQSCLGKEGRMEEWKRDCSCRRGHNLRECATEEVE